MRIVKFITSVLFILVVVFTLYIKLTANTDYVAPTIVCSEEIISVSVNDSEDKILSYVSAHDEKDGDLSDKIVIESISPFFDKNCAKITFAVCDEDDNIAKLEKDLIYSDYTKPEFRFDKQHVYYAGSTKIDLLSGVSASDNIDGDITARISISDSQIDIAQPGVYPVRYRVTTSKGVTTEIDINAYVYPSRLTDTISLSTYLVYADKDNKVNPDDYIVSYPEKYFKDSAYSVGYDYSFDVIDDVDYSAPGVYYITYRLTRTSEQNDETDVLAEAYLAVAVRGDS